jgi:hypothetical protein
VGKSLQKNLFICGEAGTARHLLAECKVLLDRGQYSRCHDGVLEIIHEAVSFSIARATKEFTTTTRAIEFIREGASTKTMNKPFSILDKAPDWILLMGKYEKQ